jgi:hypothetical protein
VLISGSLAGHPVGCGGNTWAFLQYVLGFRRLGFTTYYVRGQNEYLDIVTREWGADGTERKKLSEAITALEKNLALIRTNLASHRTAGPCES